MRYGQPSIDSAMAKLKAGGCDRVLVLPLYPQYAASTTASALDAVFATASRGCARVPALRVVAPYHDDPGYIKALAQSINDYWVKNGRPDKLLLSFHGVPRRSLDLGDPYHCHCHKTARLVASELGLTQRAVRWSRSSRASAAPEWLKPYTQPTLLALAKEGIRRVDVACPGFVSDCLETLEEIGHGRAGRLSRRRRQGVSLHSLPERAARPGSPRWPTSRCAICRAGSICRPTPPRAR